MFEFIKVISIDRIGKELEEFIGIKFRKKLVESRQSSQAIKTVEFSGSLRREVSSAWLSRWRLNSRGEPEAQTANFHYFRANDRLRPGVGELGSFACIARIVRGQGMASY